MPWLLWPVAALRQRGQARITGQAPTLGSVPLLWPFDPAKPYEEATSTVFKFKVMESHVDVLPTCMSLTLSATAAVPTSACPAPSRPSTFLARRVRWEKSMHSDYIRYVLLVDLG